MKNLWDERFSAEEYIYGTEPNLYFKEKISEIKIGKLLLPCEGEGRNAVFASKLGFDVFAFDYSKEGIKKAKSLAKANGVDFQYIHSTVEDFIYKDIDFDAIALIFAHFHRSIRNNYHSQLFSYLKSGGHLIIEAFSKEQIKNNTGGPRDLDLLYDLEELKSDLNDFNIIEAKQIKVELSEGEYHKGIAEVVRIYAVKK